MKSVRSSVLPSVRAVGAVFTSVLLLLSARPASAQKCVFDIIGDCGDEWGLSCLFATVDMLDSTACNKTGREGVASTQQWFDWLPASLAAEDGGPGGGDVWHWKTADAWNFLSVTTNVSTANPGSWPYVAMMADYPTRTVELVHSFLGDGPVTDADTDTYQFQGLAGSNVVVRLAPEIWVRCQVTPRPGDAILTLTAPDGVTVLKRERSLVPVELRATLPGDGTYTLAVSQRAGSARSYAGNYRLTFRNAASAATNTLVADVESAMFRTALDPEFDRAPQPLTASGGLLRVRTVLQCPADPTRMAVCTANGGATMALDISPNFLNHTSGLYRTNDAPFARYWLKAIGFKKKPCTIYAVASMGTQFGINGAMDIDCSNPIAPGLTVTAFGP